MTRSHATPLVLPALLAVATACSEPLAIQVEHVSRGSIEQSFREPARTRLPRTWTVTMPVDGRIGPVELQAGDRVQRGQVLVEFDSKTRELAIERARAEIGRLKAQVDLLRYDAIEETALEQIDGLLEAIAEMIQAGEAQLDAARARQELAQRNYERAEEAVRTDAIAAAERDRTDMEAKTTVLDVRTQELLVAMLRTIDKVSRLGPRFVNEWIARKRLQEAELAHAIASARAALGEAEHDLALTRITAPIDGVVLERLHDGNGPVPVGTGLVSIGDLAQLEVVAEVLTEDALHLKPGSEVELTTAATPEPILASVARIEPAGFTKLSSLGIEQQRVRVVVDLDPVPRGLGVGYRLQARFITGASGSALIVPRAAVLQAPDGTFYVFRVDGDQATRTPVTLGLSSDLEWQIESGLDEGTPIVAAPDTTMADGDKVR